MQNYCNVVISYQENWELNYLYLECFYLGIPLIHNSEILKDWGYYYPKMDVDIAVHHIKNLKYTHKKDEYIARHKNLLNRYNLSNPEIKYFFQETLNITIS